MEGPGLPPHPGFNTQADGNFFAKSCLSCLQQSGPGAEVWQVRSMTARLFQKCGPRLVSRCVSKPLVTRGKFSQHANEHTPSLRKKRDTVLQRAGLGTSSNSAMASTDASQAAGKHAHTRRDSVLRWMRSAGSLGWE